jgi:hypothetical protein
MKLRSRSEGRIRTAMSTSRIHLRRCYPIQTCNTNGRRGRTICGRTCEGTVRQGLALLPSPWRAVSFKNRMNHDGVHMRPTKLPSTFSVLLNPGLASHPWNEPGLPPMSAISYRRSCLSQSVVALLVHRGGDRFQSETYDGRVCGDAHNDTREKIE